MMETNFDIECRFFRSGARTAFNPASLIKASWTLQESGGIGQIDVVTTNLFDDAGFMPAVGDVVEVWAVGSAGESAPRARGKVTVPGRQLEAREQRQITAYGRMQDMASVLMDKVVVRYLGADLAEYAAVVASDYAKRRGLSLGTDYLTDIQPCGITLTEFSAPDTLASSAMQSLIDQASGSVVWGWEIDASSGMDLFYFRPRVETVGNQFFVGGNVRAIDATVESQALKNCVKIVGGAPKYPNLAKNSSFEAPTPPDGDSGNLLYAGGFEEASVGGEGWTYLYGASRNSEDIETGGQHSSTAHTGQYYVILDHTSANNGGQPAEEIWQEAPVALNTTYSCSLYCARERGSTAAQGELILEGRDSGGSVTESSTLELAPASTVWTGGQDSTVLASDGLQIVTVFTNSATVKCRVRILARANVSPNNGLLIDDVVFADATSVGQVGWIEKYPDHPATPGLAKFNWIDWASPQAAWEGVYGVRCNVTADSGDKPILQLAPGDQPGGEYLFKPGPQQALICGVRAKIDPGAPGNSGLTSGVVHLEYKEWGSGNALNQSQTTEYAMPADNQWRFLTVNPAVTSETFAAGQIAAPDGVQSVVAHGDASSATFKISFGVSGTYDVDGVTVRDAGSAEGSDANFGVVYATSNYLRGDTDFERYVRVDDAALAAYLTDPNVLGSITTYGEQEGLLKNDQIVDWNEDAKSYVAAWFSKWAIPIARPQVEIAHEEVQMPSPGSGLQVRVSGTRSDVPDTWASKVTYTWERQRLGLSLDLSDERPTLAKMLKALALQASSKGGGATSTLGGLLAERYRGGSGTPSGSDGIDVADAAGDSAAGVVSLAFARGTVSSPADGSAVYTPASASLAGLGEVQLAADGSGAAGLAVQASDSRLSDSRAPIGAAGGDLAGDYPSPSLAAVGAAGVFGDASHYPVITTDGKGRVTGVALQAAAAGGFAPASVIAPASVVAGLASYSGTAMAVQWHAVLGSSPASGAVAFYGWETSSDGSSWTSESFSVEGVYTGASFASGSQWARCRAYSLTSSGTVPAPSAWVASGSALAYAAPVSAGISVQGNAGQTSLNFGGGSVASMGGVSTYTPPSVTPTGVWTPGVKPPYGQAINAGQSLAGGLIAFLAFNEGAGAAAHDITTYANAFSLTNAPLWTTLSDSSTVLRFNVTASGAASQALQQSIATQSGKLAPLPNSAGLTWIGRVYLYSGSYTGNHSHFFTLSVAGQASGTGLFLRPDQSNTGALDWFAYNTAPAGSPCYGPAWSTLVGGWHQIAVTYNNATGASQLYIDGALSASSSMASGILTTAAAAGAGCSYDMCGSDSGNYNLAADLDFAAAWNRVLSASEIGAVYTSPYWLWTIGQRTVQSASSATTINNNGEVLLLANAASGGFPVTLPSYLGRSLPITVVKTDSSGNAVTAVYGGATLVTLTAQNQARRIESSGAGYVVTGGWL